MKINLLICGLLIWIVACESQPYQQGQILYENFCANCHLEDGRGLRGNIPPLANADYVRENPILTACIIQYGMEGAVVVNDTTYDEPMAAIQGLSDFEITNIINYINQAWGNDYGVVKLQEVRTALAECDGPVQDN